MRAFANLYQYGRNIDMLHEIPVRRDKKLTINLAEARKIIDGSLSRDQEFLSEIEAKQVLAHYGIPVNRTEFAASPDEAGRIASDIGCPVALKISSPDIVHKSDAGGVVLNLDSPQAVEQAFARMTVRLGREFPEADIHGASVQTMMPPADYEIIVGVKRDAQFGPVLVFGMGGVMTEIHRDTALSFPPLNGALAQEVILATKISKVMKGFRQFKAVDMTEAEEILIRVSRLATDFPEIQELDINPLWVRAGKLVGVDARIRVEKTDLVSPDHLIISPYPAWQERRAVTPDNKEIFIRPIRPEDARPLLSFFSQLSRQTVYYRFFSP